MTYLSQELTRLGYAERILFPYDYLGGFRKFKEKLVDKGKFYGLLTDIKFTDKELGYALMFGIHWKTIKDYHNLSF